MSTDQPPTPIEKQLEVIPATPDQGSDIFTNKWPLWRPGARGIFGGITIAQSLRAAQLTVPDTFSAHSMHCSFVFAGTAEDVIEYHVERVRDGKSFSTRCVRAIQRARPIFLAMISFTRQLDRPRTEKRVVEHTTPMPMGVPETDPNIIGLGQDRGISKETPYINKSVGIVSGTSTLPYAKRVHQWIKPRQTLSQTADHHVHLAALAFMSDSYFLAAVPHSHEIWHFVNAPVTEFYPSTKDMFTSSESHSAIRRPHFEPEEGAGDESAPRVAMMVSLDHTIYFHTGGQFRADQWLFAEVETSWAGDGRGLIHQRMWTKDGTLVATCIQEGIVRLDREIQETKPKSNL